MRRASDEAEDVGQRGRGRTIVGTLDFGDGKTCTVALTRGARVRVVSRTVAAL